MCSDEENLKNDVYYHGLKHPQATAQDMCGSTLKSVQVPLKERLYKQRASGTEHIHRAEQMLEILNRHPEFEEFLRLQELLKQAGLYY